MKKLTFKCHLNVVCISATSHRIPTELVGVMFPYIGHSIRTGILPTCSQTRPAG